MILGIPFLWFFFRSLIVMAIGLSTLSNLWAAVPEPSLTDAANASETPAVAAAKPLGGAEDLLFG